MTYIGKWFLSVLFGLLLAAPVQAQEIMVGGGGGGTSDGLGVQNGTMYIAVGKPGITFGLKQKPGSEPEMAYLVIFRHKVTDGAQVGGGSRNQAVGGGTMRAEMTHDLELHGKMFTIAEELEFDPAAREFKKEAATINGQTVDMKAGRVFLVDFTGDKLTWKQVKAKLPTQLPDLKETDDIRKLVKQVMKELPRESSEVRQFLK